MTDWLKGIQFLYPVHDRDYTIKGKAALCRAALSGIQFPLSGDESHSLPVQYNFLRVQFAINYHTYNIYADIEILVYLIQSFGKI